MPYPSPVLINPVCIRASLHARVAYSAPHKGIVKTIARLAPKWLLPLQRNPRKKGNYRPPPAEECAEMALQCKKVGDCYFYYCKYRHHPKRTLRFAVLKRRNVINSFPLNILFQGSLSTVSMYHHCHSATRPFARTSTNIKAMF